MHNRFLTLATKNQEFALFMKPRRLPAKVELLNFYVNWSELEDTIHLRINFYAVTDSMPGNNLLMQDIVVKHLIERGWNELDLRPYNIVMAEEFFVSVQWLDDLDQKTEKRFRYAGVLIRPRNMYVRSTLFSTAIWQKIPGIVKSMYLQVLN